MYTYDDLMDVRGYVLYKKEALNELHILQYCTKEEIYALDTCENEIKVDIMSRTLMDKYWNVMLNNYGEKYEKELVVKDPDMEIEKSKLHKRIKKVLAMANIITFEDFADYVTEYGWGNIFGFNELYARSVFAYCTDGVDANEYRKVR